MQLWRNLWWKKFYSLSRPTHKNWFKEQHGYPFPTKPNALICSFCHKDFEYKDLASLKTPKTFSARNGFGPVQYITDEIVSANPEDINYKLAQELQHLLLSFTIVEEAAIRTIVPLMSIVRLNHGSIKTKGNTSCVWQHSQLCTVLPNLPSECKIIVITRRNKKGDKGKSKLASTKLKEENWKSIVLTE